MRKLLFLIITALGLTLLFFFLWRPSRQAPEFAAGDAMSPLFYSAASNNKSPNGFLINQINEGPESILSDLSLADKSEHLGQALRTLSHHDLFTRASDLKVAMQQGVKVLAAKEQFEEYKDITAEIGGRTIFWLLGLEI